VFRAEGLQVSRGGRKLFAGNGIDLNIRGPERIALSGPNRAGRSTLLRVIDGELQPDAGALVRA
jgi:ABC-type hemin transport system ATPase subunit